MNAPIATPPAPGVLSKVLMSIVALNALVLAFLFATALLTGLVRVSIAVVKFVWAL
jgi:hypothetical protein